MRNVAFFACVLFLSLLAEACSESTLFVSECHSTRDCGTDEVCEEGVCVPGFTPPDRTDEDGDLETENGQEDEAPPLPDGDDVDGDGDGSEDPPDTVDGDDPDSETPQDGDTDDDEELDIPPGNTCEDAPLLLLDTPTRGTTIGASDSLQATSCNATPLRGADVVFRLSLEAGDEIQVTVAPSTDGYNPAVYLLDACTSDATCLAHADSGRADQSESFSFHSPAGGDFFVVVDSLITPDRSGGQGDFVIAARRYPPVTECQPCGEGLPPCGPASGCVEFEDSSGIVERACVHRCTEDSDCQQAFVCRNARVAGGEVGKHCLPRYGSSDGSRHAVGTCAAMLDMGTPCPWRVLGDNTASCGASPGRAVNDAVCIFFPGLTELVSYCTIYCVEDSECPEGFNCYKFPWPSNDRVCRITR